MRNYYVTTGVDLDKIKLEAAAKRDSGEDDSIIHFHSSSVECETNKIHEVYFRDGKEPEVNG